MSATLTEPWTRRGALLVLSLTYELTPLEDGWVDALAPGEALARLVPRGRGDRIYHVESAEDRAAERLAFRAMLGHPDMGPPHPALTAAFLVASWMDLPVVRLQFPLDQLPLDVRSGEAWRAGMLGRDVAERDHFEVPVPWMFLPWVRSGRCDLPFDAPQLRR